MSTEMSGKNVLARKKLIQSIPVISREVLVILPYQERRSDFLRIGTDLSIDE